MKVKKLLTLLPLLAIALTGCDGVSNTSPSGTQTTEDPSLGYDDGVANDDIDNGYHYSLSIDKTDIPECLEVGGEGFTLKINMTTDEPGANTTPGEDTLVIRNTDSSVVSIDGLTITPVGRGTTTIKVEWLHHSSCYDHVNVIVRNEGEVDQSGYQYNISITNKDSLPSLYYVGMDDVTLEIEMFSTHPDYEGIEASTETVRVTSSDESIVKVDGFTLTPLSQGRVTIRAIFIGHESTYDSLTIEVSTKPILNYTLNFTITYNGSPLECPDFGHIYMNYGLNDMAYTTYWIKLETDATVGSYHCTFDAIPWGDYGYQLNFVYDGEEEDMESYLHQVTGSYGVNESFSIAEEAEDGDSQSLTVVSNIDLMDLPAHDVKLTNYTLQFNITYGGVSQQTGYGWSVYIAGGFNGWTFEACEYNEITVGSKWAYTYVFDSIYPGTYEYKLVYAPEGEASWVDNRQITPGTTNQTFIVTGTEGNDYTNQINIASAISFASVDGLTRGQEVKT